MTVEQLIDELDLIEDKTKQVYINVEEPAYEVNTTYDYPSTDIGVYEYKNMVEIGGYVDK